MCVEKIIPHEQHSRRDRSYPPAESALIHVHRQQGLTSIQLNKYILTFLSLPQNSTTRIHVCQSENVAGMCRIC